MKLIHVHAVLYTLLASTIIKVNDDIYKNLTVKFEKLMLKSDKAFKHKHMHVLMFSP